VKINIIKQEGDTLEIEFSGEGPTLLNLLQSSLLEDSNVEMAGYTKPHPLMDRSRLFIKLKKSGNHLEILSRASKNAHDKLSEFLLSFEKSFLDFNE
jgi:DNA-directed RNA polymerase subunit L